MIVKILILLPVILLLAAVMTMTGRGGGNFYVPLLVAAGQPMHEAATTGQLILVAAALTGMLIFHKHKKVDWKLALVIDPPTDIMAFVGGYFSYLVSGVALKFILSALLLVAAFCMLLRAHERPIGDRKRFGFWRRTFGGNQYVVNLRWIIQGPPHGTALRRADGCGRGHLFGHGRRYCIDGIPWALDRRPFRLAVGCAGGLLRRRRKHHRRQASTENAAESAENGLRTHHPRRGHLHGHQRPVVLTASKDRRRGVGQDGVLSLLFTYPVGVRNVGLGCGGRITTWT